MYAFALPDRSQPILDSSVVILSIEVLKFVIALTTVSFTTRNFTLEHLHLFLLQSLLYFFNNVMYFSAVQWSSAAVVSILLHFRLPITGILHHFFIKPQTSRWAWICLATIYIGVVISQLNENLSLENGWAVFICGVIALNSSIASILNERMLKGLGMPFWDQQLRLYGLGVLSAGLFVFGKWAKASAAATSTTATIKSTRMLADDTGHTKMGIILALSDGLFVHKSSHNPGSILTATGAILFGAGAGIMTGVVVYKLDSVVKLVSQAIVSVLVTLCVLLVFGRFNGNAGAFVQGALLLVGATYGYARVSSSSGNGSSNGHGSVGGKELGASALTILPAMSTSATTLPKPVSFPLLQISTTSLSQLPVEFHGSVFDFRQWWPFSTKQSHLRVPTDADGDIELFNNTEWDDNSNYIASEVDPHDSDDD
jgi:uncharacterized membrane protein